jgi:hypothetical protein
MSVHDYVMEVHSDERTGSSAFRWNCSRLDCRAVYPVMQAAQRKRAGVGNIEKAAGLSGGFLTIG